MSSSTQDDRIKNEAAFQNARVVARTTGDTEPRDRFYYLADRAYAQYRQTLSDVKGKHILVVGCSEGGVTPLARCGAHVTGIDISEEAIRLLDRAITEEGLMACASTQLMNAENLSFPPNSFDVIACTGVLHHLNVELAASSWAAALKPDGFVTMLEPMARHPLAAIYRLLTPNMRTPDEHPLAPNDIATLHRHFSQVTVQGFALSSVLSVMFAYLPRSHRLRDWTCRQLERVDQRLLKIIPSLSYYCWTSVIVCRGPRAASGC